VDTHVHRVAQRLGWIGPRVNAEVAHETLARAIPAEWQHTLHVDLIRLGREICHARAPECERCPLRAECRYFWTQVQQGHLGASVGV
jgi:endonuclease-3